MASSPAGDRVNAVILAFTAVAGMVLFFRLFTKIAVVRNAGFEDFCVTFAMVLSIGLTVAIGEQVRHGMGVSMKNLTPAEMVLSQKAFWASIWMYNLSLTMTKISILVQYLRIFQTPRFSLICKAMIGFVAVYGLWTLFGSIFLCLPVQFFWDKSIAGGRCLDQRIWFANASVNIAQDFAILFLPMPVLRRLSVPTKQKKSLMVIFGLGGIVCIISVVRLQSLVAISNSPDPTLDNSAAAALSSVETNVGIITACLPSMRPLLSGLFPTYFPSTNQRYPNARSRDEEQGKEFTTVFNTNSTAAGKSGRPSISRPGTSSTRSGNGSQRSNMETPLAGTGARVNAPPRQIYIKPQASTARLQTPRLPMLPEDMARIGSMEMDLRKSRHSRNWSGSTIGRSEPLPQRLSVVQKPLPITPLPGAI